MSNNKTTPNEPINPIVETNSYPYGEVRMECTFAGLTKREYFAGLAMQGILANPNNDGNPKYAAKHSVECSEELIKALNNEQQ